MSDIRRRVDRIERCVTTEHDVCSWCGNPTGTPAVGSVVFVIVDHVDVWRCPQCGQQLAFTMTLDRPGEPNDPLVA